MKIESLGRMTPAEAFLSVRRLPYAMVFSKRDCTDGTFTVICASPFATVKAEDRSIAVTGEARLSARVKTQDPLDAVSAVFEAVVKEYGPFDRGPFPFNGGAAGYFAYDLKNVLEGGRPEAGGSAAGGGVKVARGGGLGLPLLIAAFFGSVYVYDHGKEEAFLVDRGIGGEASSVFKETLTRAVKAVEGTNKATHVKAPASFGPGGPGDSHGVTTDLVSNTTKEEYIAGIRKALDYISSGDIYQINLSHMLTIPFNGDPFGLYTSITEKSPARFGAYLDLGEFKIISNSPERLLRVEGGLIETSPIKGTRPRGLTREDDIRLIEELRGSRKERAEHVMIVDLERNDLGRVAVPGSVEVSEFERIETLAGLHHMVSTVRARLAPDADAFKCLKVAFPGGSVTGAPKIRAMEIIDEIEKGPRSIYTGGIGWIDLSGSMDLSMAIRTAVYRDSHIHLSVGGGIVADSDPEAEYDETILKAKDFIELTRGQTASTAL